MKNKLYYSILVLLIFVVAFQGKAQTFNCGTSTAQEELYQKYPELRKQQAEFDTYVRNYVQEHYNEANRNIIIIPVVFHIIHDFGVENISDAQVLEQVDILNRDYNLLNSDTTQVIPEFKPIMANIGIEFRLAQKDPQGNCTNGIDRVASPLTYLGNDAAKLNPWDRRNYLNVWTVKKMQNGVAGYAYKPQSVSGVNFPIDGIIILHDYIGASGTSIPSHSRALTHEIGHWLNLSHPWGDNNNPGQACGDDGIQDTPITKGWTTCPTPANAAICTPGIIENYQNYMDYSYCSVMFTEGQKQALMAALNNDVSFRNHLWTDENLLQTGVLSPTVCAPTADFFTTTKLICVGSSVIFKDNSVRATPTSWNWSFPGGTPSSSTSQNPVIAYQTPGYYEVTLTVSNANGSNTSTKNNYIYASPNWSDYSANYIESFEDIGLSERWFKINPSNNNKKWQHVSDVGASGNSSLLLSGFYQGEGDVDELITPAYDLRYMSSINLSFKYIGASKATIINDIKDSLNIYVSTDCGKSWGTPKLTIKRANLIKAGQTEQFYKPASNDVWTTANVALGAVYAVANVRFRFRYTSGEFSNNFYLDDFNISGVVGNNELNSSINKLNIAPNPFHNEALITLNIDKTERITIDLMDVTGRKITTIFNGVQTNNTMNYILEKQNLNQGVYLIIAQIGDDQIFKKVIID